MGLRLEGPASERNGSVRIIVPVSVGNNRTGERNGTATAEKITVHTLSEIESVEADLYLEIKGRCGRFGNFVENFSLIDLVLISGKKIISLQFFYHGS